MNRMIFALTIFVLSSCANDKYKIPEVAGIYKGYANLMSGGRKIDMGEFQLLYLKEDSTCKYIWKFDLARGAGIGRWIIQNDSIIIKYNDIPHKNEPDYLLSSGRDVEGMDTFLIHSKNQLRKEGMIKDYYKKGKLIKSHKYVTKYRRVRED